MDLAVMEKANTVEMLNYSFFPENILRFTKDINEYVPGNPAGPVELSSPESLLTMMASMDVLRREWENPDEDAAWAHL
jgi:hypothetical protein